MHLKYFQRLRNCQYELSLTLPACDNVTPLLKPATDPFCTTITLGLPPGGFVTLFPWEAICTVWIGFGEFLAMNVAVPAGRMPGVEADVVFRVTTRGALPTDNTQLYHFKLIFP